MTLRRVVGLLVCVELVSGVLQGYYTPIYSDIAHHLSIHDADVNWFEAAQLVVSAIAVPVLARMGDLIGHRKVLLITSALTALASWAVAFAPSFSSFLVAWALQGFYVVWLPMEVSIIHSRTARSGAQSRLTRRATATLVAALETGVIVGALVSGAIVGPVGITFVLMIPAVAVTGCFAVVWFGIRDTARTSAGRLDLRGVSMVVVVLALVMAGLIFIRLHGAGSVLAWLLILAGLLMLVPFGRMEAATEEPLIDVRLLRDARQWPVQLTSFLFGMSVLGAQIPLSTFARTDPTVTGYGLGASASFVSVLVGAYVITMLVGALCLPYAARRLGPRGALIAACTLVALGYGMWIVMHNGLAAAVTNMCVIGAGSGALVAALPAAAASAAPAGRTGFVTGMTNTTKTIGGAIASAVFAIALATTGSLDTDTAHAPLSGYLWIWSVCAGTALLAAVALLLVPRGSFADPAEVIGTTVSRVSG
ncbi:MFS transporter [Leekyejoonella antrihumi]|uniref:MFS transporter n=2 Tax=Leekyejoonella antrihumi TaxID=1660198 RepID=A0A563E2Y0_9MICO|nr:MFS transporter [Leekyejoonella antrihumi]